MVTATTLCYIIKGGKVLLIMKKRGLGAGMWNGPGGKINENESLDDAASRETFEEVGVVPQSMKKMGEISFYFGQEQTADGRVSDASVEPDWLVHVFVASESYGIEKESDEAVPKWFPVGRIPYDDMWPDDKIWLPLVLQGKRISGKFYFDKDKKTILKHNVEVI